MSYNHNWPDYDYQKFNRDHSPCTCGSHGHTTKSHTCHCQCFDEPCSCKKQVRRLNRLEFGLTQRLRHLVDMEIIVEFLGGEENEGIRGMLILVGSDFIELAVGTKKKETIRFIPFTAIKWIEEVPVK